jgi:predicted secreted protein
MERRSFLTGLAGIAALALDGPAMLVRPANAAVSRMRDAFNLADEAEVRRFLFPGLNARESSRVAVTLPNMAKPGQGMMVRVDYEFEPAQAIAITAENEPRPLIAFAAFHVGAASFAARIRLTRTTALRAYVLSKSGLSAASRTVKITRGGYGTTFN